MDNDICTFIDLEDTTRNLRIKCKPSPLLGFGEHNFIRQKLMYLESVECRKNYTREEIDISRKYYTQRFKENIQSYQRSSPTSFGSAIPSLTLPQSTVSFITLSLNGTL